MGGRAANKLLAREADATHFLARKKAIDGIKVGQPIAARMETDNRERSEFMLPKVLPLSRESGPKQQEPGGNRRN